MSLLTARLEYVHPWPNAAGLYVARTEGLLREHGLDIEVTYGGWDRGDSATLLDRGEVDLAVVPPNRLLAQRAAGARIVAVAAINQVPLEALISTRDRGIARPRDVAGKRVGFVATPRLLTILRSVVAADGGDPDAIVVVDTSPYEPNISDVVRGDFDAVINIKAWEPLLSDVAPEDRVVLPFGDVGGPSYPSYLWTVRAAAIEANPTLVSLLVGALAEGYRISTEEPARALAALSTVLPSYRPQIVKESLEIVTPSWHRDGIWGVIDPAQLAGYADWLVAHGLLASLDGLPGATTSAFLPVAAP